MRNSRRNAFHGNEFGGSGEDSFVAVVVTKLTGALLFILLLTMVIMALLPKAADLPSSDRRGADGPDESVPELSITTPEALPEAIAGRPYTLALAASGGRGPVKWSVAGPLPEGLSLDPGLGLIQGTPKKGTPKPAELVLRAGDGRSQATRATALVVYESDKPLTTPVWWKPGIPPVPWRAWLDQGFGFLVLWLVHVVGINTLGGFQRWALASLGNDPTAGDADRHSVVFRFTVYRTAVRIASLAAATALVVWFWRHHA